MINSIDEKSEKKANELEEQYQKILKLCGETIPDIELIAANIQAGLENNNHKLKKFLAKGLYEQGKIDEAVEMLKDVPMDDEVRELHRALRYADEARGIVSNVSPETEKYFEELSKRLGIKK